MQIRNASICLQIAETLYNEPSNTFVTPHGTAFRGILFEDSVKRRDSDSEWNAYKIDSEFVLFTDKCFWGGLEWTNVILSCWPL